MTYQPSQPGWYPDPSGTPGQRYWNGHAWAKPFSAPPDSRHQPTTPRTRAPSLALVLMILGVVVVVIGTVIVIDVAASGGSRDERSYQYGIELGSPGGSARGLHRNTGTDPEHACREMLKLMFSFGDDGMDFADAEQGCIDAMS